VTIALSWNALLFYGSVGLGALLAIGAAWGTIDGDADGDSHGDVDGHDGSGSRDHDGTSLLALGRLPLTVRLMLLAFGFGGVGLVLGPWVCALVPSPVLLGQMLTIGISIVGAWAVARLGARLCARCLPLFETETVSRRDLVGTTGLLTLAASERGGVAQVKDRRGNLHQVACRVRGEGRDLPAGVQVLLIDYDEGAQVYWATAHPG